MLRKLLTTTALVCFAGSAALAADLPSTKEAPVYAPPPPPAFTWTGVYIGGQVGYGWGTSNVYNETDAVTEPNLTQSGIVGGAHIGYNYQVSQFVFGLEGDVNGSSESNSQFNAPVEYGIRKNVDASIRGRIGYAFDRVLIYATGGGAYGDFHTTYNDGIVFDSFNHGRLRLDGRRRHRICHRQQLVGPRRIPLHRLRLHLRLSGHRGQRYGESAYPRQPHSGGLLV